MTSTNRATTSATPPPLPPRQATAPRSQFSPRALLRTATRFAALTAPMPNGAHPDPVVPTLGEPSQPPGRAGHDQCDIWPPLSYDPPPASLDDALQELDLGRSERTRETDVLALLDRIVDADGGTSAGRMWSVLRTVDPLSFFEAMVTRSACGPRMDDNGDRWLEDCFEQTLGPTTDFGIGPPRVPSDRQLDPINLAYVVAEPLLSHYIDRRDRRQPPFARADIEQHAGRAIYRKRDAETRRNYFCLLPDVDAERRPDDDAGRTAELDRHEAYPPTPVHELMHGSAHPNWMRVLHALPRRIRFAIDESAADRALEHITGNVTGSAYQVHGFTRFRDPGPPGRLTSIYVARFIESALASPSDPDSGFDRLMRCYLSGDLVRLADLADAACEFAAQFGEVPIDRTRLDRVLDDLRAGRPAKLPAPWLKWLDLAAFTILVYAIAVQGNRLVADAVDRWQA